MKNALPAISAPRKQSDVAVWNACTARPGGVPLPRSAALK
jgi:hypothetical protein